jgi:hypothetical protein
LVVGVVDKTRVVNNVVEVVALDDVEQLVELLVVQILLLDFVTLVDLTVRMQMK